MNDPRRAPLMPLDDALTALLSRVVPTASVESVATFDAARLSEHARILSDDSFQGRGIATPAEDMVVRYLSEQYAAAGFQPGGENGGWTQAVGLNRFTVSNVSGQIKVGDWTQPLAQGQQATITTRLPSDGVDLRAMDPAALRAQLALVPQQPTLFAASARDNIR